MPLAGGAADKYGGCCTDQPLPSGSLKKTNEPKLSPGPYASLNDPSRSSRSLSRCSLNLKAALSRASRASASFSKG